MLYHLFLEDEGPWDGHNTGRNILAALRVDPGLHIEAMLVFCKANTFCLTERNHWLISHFLQHNGVRFMDTSIISMASTFQNVYVKVPLSTSITGPCNGRASTTPTFNRTARIIRMAQNLTHLQIESSSSGDKLDRCIHWLALVCDLVGPADSCPVLQQLKITWSAYVLDRHGLSIDYMIRQLDKVFATPGRLEGSFTGSKYSWVWEHRGKDKSKLLKWGNGSGSERIVLSLSDMIAMDCEDYEIYNDHQIWAARRGMPSIFYIQQWGPGQGRLRRSYAAQPELDWVPDSLREVEETPMWRNVGKRSFDPIRGICEREQKRNSLLRHEKDDNYVTKWLYDQGFECGIYDTNRYIVTSGWQYNQFELGSPSQRGEEGELDFVPDVVEVDEFDTRSRAPSVDAQPTVPRDPLKPRLKKHSALPSDWSRADSDAGLPEGESVYGRQKEKSGVHLDAASSTSGNTELLEDIVFCPGEARYQIVESRNAS